MQKKLLTQKSSYWYNLPKELIAQHPKEKRSESRLLYLNKNSENISHHKFTDILDILTPNDLLVINITKVIPARLFGKKTTGAEVEIFLLNQIANDRWECLVKPGRRLKKGAEVIFSENFIGRIIDYAEDGNRIIEFSWQGDFWENLEKMGKMPLPPYIQREATEDDKRTYQTVFAQNRGSVAAPTAGLHFTDELLNKIRKKGVTICEVILQVGLGTFRPVKSENIKDHKMHSEYCTVPPKTAKIINSAKKDNKRVIAVGTTTTRTLESFTENGILLSGSKWTDIFIYPGEKLQMIDGLLTNFHMPESTLMMLVSAFAGHENIMSAYKIAVQQNYRFFSYGDAMLIL